MTKPLKSLVLFAPVQMMRNHPDGARTIQPDPCRSCHGTARARHGGGRVASAAERPLPPTPNRVSEISIAPDTSALAMGFGGAG